MASPWCLNFLALTGSCYMEFFVLMYLGSLLQMLYVILHEKWTISLVCFLNPFSENTRNFDSTLGLE